MADLKKLLDEKAQRLSDIPDQLLSRAEKAEKQLLKELIELMGSLDRTASGMLVSSSKNLSIAAEIIERLKEEFYLSDYAEAVSDFAGEFDKQILVADRLIKDTFSEFSTSAFGKEVVDKSKQNAVELLLGAEAESAIFIPIKEALETAVISGNSYRETIKALEPLFEGEDGGKIKQYSSQIAHDAFAIADRQYMSVVSDELEAEWFFYSGGLIASSRPFCVKRHEQYFYYKEVESWVENEWAGMIEGTTKQTIYSYAGGYQCRHSIVPVSISDVPLEVIQRNIANGNFTPSKFEVEELGL